MKFFALILSLLVVSGCSMQTQPADGIDRDGLAEQLAGQRTEEPSVSPEASAEVKTDFTPEPTSEAVSIDISSVGEGPDGYYTTIDGYDAVVYPGLPDGANYNTLIIGDSLTVGLFANSDLHGARVYARVNAHTRQMIDELENFAGGYIDESIDKVIVTLGSNDRGEDISYEYKNLIDYIRGEMPASEIFISVIPYANEKKAADAGYDDVSETDFDNTNRSIRALAGYGENISVCEALQEPWAKVIVTDEEASTDGLHFTQDMYKKWAARLYELGLLSKQ